MADAPATSDVASGFRQAMRRVASTVSIITAVDGDRRHGMTVTALTSVSMEPPSLIVCINRSTRLHEIMMRADTFCANVLNSGQEEHSRAFSGAVPHDLRFDVGAWANDVPGHIYLADAQANLFCRRVSFMSHGTHTVFIGAVEGARVRDPVAPLIYLDAAYRIASGA